ncbi:putative DNA modification/repair radical SAM protein [Dorea longicatena]|uniref:putative DNA modification/repair radical SAM protein n=1 Tax=Dorea longicatena TaxID=88431 RepID=UPI0036F3E564
MNIEIKNSNYTTQEKLQILADAAKYDVACTSSGSSRRGKKGELGNTEACGICHSFAADGRCISLLKILMTNHCAYDCKYCINRASNDVKRATFTPEEICELTIEFYRRNYIEGLFLSSGVLKNPTYTMEKMCETLLLLRTKYHFNGYIHVKTIPGASDELLAAAGYLADRISVNLELPTEESLRTLAPNKTMKTILNPMGKVQNTIAAHRMAIGKTAYMERSRGNQLLNNGIFSEISKRNYRESLEEKKKTDRLSDGKDGTLSSQKEMVTLDGLLTWDNAYQLAPRDMSGLKRRFAPAGQSTQMIIGATGESDYTLLQTTQQLYQGFDLKRVFYSAYIPLNEDAALPGLGTPAPILREHRLYQADWLLRFYGFQADELLSEEKPDFNELIDPKCDWALRHLEQFPVEVETASYARLLRVPGIGPKSASRITYARRYGRMDFASLKKMGVVLKRAHYFITCGGKQMYHTPIEASYITRQLVSVDKKDVWNIEHSNESYVQLSLADFGIG